MTEISGAYLLEIAKQLSFIAALLGGLSGALMCALLFSRSDSPAVKWALFSAATATCAFIVSVVALTMLIVGLNPNAPESLVTQAGLLQARSIGTVGFFLGLYGTLFTIGACGWVRSRRMGVATTILAGAACIATTRCLI